MFLIESKGDRIHLFLQIQQSRNQLQLTKGVLKIILRALQLQLFPLKTTDLQPIFYPKLVHLQNQSMDSEDNDSTHSSNLSSTDSNPISNSLSRHLSSTSSSSNEPHLHDDIHSLDEMDRYQENTIGFDSFSEYSNNPLNQGFVANQDSFFSEYKSLYSSISGNRLNDFSRSMEQNDSDDRYESNSFSSFHSLVSSSQVSSLSNKRKGSRQRSRGKKRREDKQELGFYMVEDLNSSHSKRVEGGFKKKK